MDHSYLQNHKGSLNFLPFFVIFILHASFKFKFLSLKQKGEELDFFTTSKL